VRSPVGAHHARQALTMTRSPPSTWAVPASATELYTALDRHTAEGHVQLVSEESVSGRVRR
jgi:hypothetical protein